MSNRTQNKNIKYKKLLSNNKETTNTQTQLMTF